MKAYSFEYSQPDDYHFCQDSILAPRLVVQDLSNFEIKSDSIRALDLCAGCGVMGFELLHNLRTLDPAMAEKIDFDFLDVQSAFASHIQRNLEITGSRGQWLNENYASLCRFEFANRYDLIISNPPYFLKGEGSLSPNDLNNRARFFIDSDFQTLLQGVRNALKPQGRAYLLMKSGKEHGRDAFTSARIELFDCRVERLADVRGTDLVRITRD
jgi:tRNA1(Val) A37 N6-methylase TrmN6